MRAPSGAPGPLGRAIDGLRRRLDRPGRSPRQRMVRGALVLLVGSVVAVGLGMALVALSRNVPLAWTVELVVLTLLAGQRGAFGIGRRAMRALEAGKGQGQTRLLAETAADRLVLRFADGPMALVVWLAVLGLPGVLVYRLSGWLSGGLHETGAQSQGATPYDRVPALLHRLMLVPSALLTAALGLVVAVGLPGARPVAGLASLMGVRRFGPDLACRPLRVALSPPAAEVRAATPQRGLEAALRRLRRSVALFALMGVVLVLACLGAGVGLWLNPPRP
ncbi:hypothetical protein [Zavarzinia sp. CC-PAN008]|uniref:hypothetical protein n=1 Tax=Zavarzinia sp. CC-PAN008 TaxID=3243332 RepID=UPI003F744E05